MKFTPGLENKSHHGAWDPLTKETPGNSGVQAAQFTGSSVQLVITDSIEESNLEKLYKLNVLKK
jgi:hypothetical protein